MVPNGTLLCASLTLLFLWFSSSWFDFDLSSTDSSSFDFYSLLHLCKNIFIGTVILMILLVTLLNPQNNSQNQNRRKHKKSSSVSSLTSQNNQMDPKSRLDFIKSMAFEAFISALESAKLDHSTANSMVASLSTLWIMDLKPEFETAREWIKQNLDAIIYECDKTVNVYELVVNYIGGFLSTYALTQDEYFRDKAQELAEKLKPAYQTGTGLPYPEICLKSGKPKISTTNSTTNILSQVGGQYLEFAYLSELTRDFTYRILVDKIRAILKRADKPKGLYFYELDLETGGWKSFLSTFGSLQKDFYLCLIKSYIQSNGKDVEALQLYREALDSLEQNRMFEHSRTGLLYARGYAYKSDNYNDSMDYDCAYLGGMLALGANSIKKLEDDGNENKETAERHDELAQELTETCHEAAMQTATGLPPDRFYFDNKDDGTNSTGEDQCYYLSPELAESYFIQHRLTHEAKYQEYAWQMAQAIQRHCRHDQNSGGYSAIENVNKIPTVKLHFMSPEFMSATLKFLYLTFTDDSILPLDQWIFNSVGHSLPVAGQANS